MLEGMAATLSGDVTTLRAALMDSKAEAARAKAINADLVARVALLELQNEKMRRALYGQRSERGQLLFDQLELGLEELEASAGEDETLGARAAVGNGVEAFTRARPSRKSLPAHLPRERIVVPAQTSRSTVIVTAMPAKAWISACPRWPIRSAPVPRRCDRSTC